MLTAALFAGRNRRNRKQCTCPLTEAWVRRYECMYTVKYYLVIKKEQNNAIRSNMDGPRLSNRVK